MCKFTHISPSKIFAIGILLLVIASYLFINSFVNSSEVNKEYVVYSKKIDEIPILDKDASDSAKLEVSAKAVYIEDIDTGTVLFEKNAERLLLPASTTKLITALVVRDLFSLDEVVTVTNVEQIEGFSVGLHNGEKLTVHSLLKSALIQSSNDSAFNLAMHYQAGVDEFVKLMNKKAEELHLKSSYFQNPAGFDDKEQRSSAHDLAIIAKEVMKDEVLREIVGTKHTSISDVTEQYVHQLYSTHQLLGVDPSVVGIKTGTTNGASEVLITQFNRRGHRVIIVLMGSEDRYKETASLIDWVFANYVWLTPTQILEKS